VRWVEREEIYVPTSSLSKRVDLRITPWLREPLSRLVDGTRSVTFVKPVQCGGSTFGEVALLYWIVWGRSGFLQYNWSDDGKARDRWESRVQKLLWGNAVVLRKIQGLARHEAVKGEIDFGNIFFRMQGAFNPSNLDSDSVRYQINEEVHDWEPGHLAKAYGRTTAIWNAIILNISNAGKKGDQLHQALEEGTNQQWEVKCNGCGNPHHEANTVFHIMRTRWEEKRPDLGGLRYEAEGCRRDDGSYDYNRLEGTIRYQMPCGFQVRDNPRDRAVMSRGGRYGPPRNMGAHLSNRSYTLEAVAVDYIPWLKLIQEKHKALLARRHGDPEPWRRYVTERECGFYDPGDFPITGTITLSTERKKSRTGLFEGRGEDGRWQMADGKTGLRFFALDRQKGKGARQEFPHWWMVIRDVDEDGNSLLVFEGKLETDDQVLAVLKDHECEPHHGVADSGFNATHVYLFCLQNGINAIKGGAAPFYAHPDGARRIFGPEKPLHGFINRDPKYDYVMNTEGDHQPDPREPLFWFYSKPGIRERLAWLRNSTKWEVPGDVSLEYQSHMESEEMVERKNARTGEIFHEWRQLKERNDLFVCECYIAMQIEMAGLIGGIEEEGPEVGGERGEGRGTDEGGKE
jgi:hypothetical protein